MASSPTPAAPLDAVVVGAGFAGLYMLHRLRELGLSARGLRGRRRRRRHLVLEPLPRRPLRRREHGVLLLLLRRAAAGVGVERALRRPSPRSCATSTTSPTGSTCAATSSSRPASTAARFDEAANRWTIATDRRRARSRPASASWRPAACRPPQRPRLPGPRELRRARPTTPATGRTRASTSPASASASSAPARRPSSRSRSSPRRPRTLNVFQRTPNFSMPARNAPLDPEYERRHQGRLRRAAGARRREIALRRLRRADHRRSRRWRSPERSASASTRRAGSAAASASCGAYNDLLVRRGANDTAAEFVREQDPRASSRDPEVAEAAAPAGLPDRHQAAVRRHRLLRHLQPRQRHAGRCPRRRRSRRSPRTGMRDRRHGVRARQPSSSPPASTP